MRTVPALAAAALLGAAVGAQAQPRPPVPPVVLTHMNGLDARCKAAGGQPFGGRYVFAQDFTGDGRIDYLLSEGDYNCAGRPSAFRQNGEARVDIFVTNARNETLRAYSDTLIAYRLLAGSPVRVQIARRGAACGPGVAASTPCAAQLAWNGRTFGEAAAGGAASKAPEAVVPPASTPAVAGVPANTRTGFLAQCRRDYVREDASAARWADKQCETDWGRVVASGPAAEALLAAAPAPGERASLAVVRQRLGAVRWAPRATAPSLAVGALGDLSASIEGKAAPTAVSLAWMKVGAEIPYDIVAALRVRGATLTESSCEKLSVGEGSRVYAGSAPGRAPFTLTVDQRTAPTANANSYYGVKLGLDGRAPPRGSTADCDF